MFNIVNGSFKTLLFAFAIWEDVNISDIPTDNDIIFCKSRKNIGLNVQC